MKQKTENSKKQIKNSSKNTNNGKSLVSRAVTYFAEDHGLHTLFVLVMIILLSLFIIVVAKNFIK